MTSGRCSQHQVKQQDRRLKDPTQARYYGSKVWKELRAQVRREEPWCRLCGTNPTTTVDHVDEDWRNGARSNLRGLCDTCERSRTGRQHRAKRGDGR